MRRIFISYRRQDSQSAAGRLTDDLNDHFGPAQIFRDIETIEPGADFTESLMTALNSCAILIAIIGPRWLNSTDKKGQRRLDDPKDWTRQEIEIALSRNIRVIPVLVDGAVMFDADDLPQELKPLAKRQAYELTDKRWNQDITQLIATIEQILGMKDGGRTKFGNSTHLKSVKVIVSMGLLLSGLGSWAWLHWASTSQVTVFDQEHARIISAKVINALIPFINSNRFSNGGYGDEHNATRSDAWTSAQCLSALLLFKDAIPDPEILKTTFAYIRTVREQGGWSRSQNGKKPLTEVTAWVGLAYVTSLSDATFWSVSERKKVLDELTAIYEEVVRRQSDQGGWSSYQTSYSKPTAFAPYATDMALLFLLQLKKSNLLPVNNGVLDQKITNGLYWILSEYASGLSGWEDGKGEGLHEDLTTLHLVLLTMAKRYGFSSVEADRRYREARKGWLQQAWKHAEKRSVSELSRARQKQEIFDTNGTLIGEYDVTVGLVWYPWTLLLANYLTDDQDLVGDERQNSSRILATLWPKLPTQVDAVSSGATYRAAETLFVLGTIRKGLQWR